jgi:O-antigen ligase
MADEQCLKMANESVKSKTLLANLSCQLRKSIFHLHSSTVPHVALIALEMWTCLFLSIELLLRFCFSRSKKAFFKQFLNFCDLIVLLPSIALMSLIIITLINGHSQHITTALAFVATARIIRIISVFRFTKNFHTLHIIVASLKMSVPELVLLLILIVSASLFYASMLFYIEMGNNNMQHIPDAMWWAIVTMTTVGYGDVYPVSGGGYVVGSLCAITGILIIALPTPVIVNNFSTLYNSFKACSQLSDRERRKPTTGLSKQEKVQKDNNQQKMKQDCNNISDWL